MAILGNIIKGIIEIKDTFTPELNPVEAQKAVLKTLLTKAENTEFGKHYNFESILDSDAMATAFSDTVPYFDYNKIYYLFQHCTHEGTRIFCTYGMTSKNGRGKTRNILKWD